MRTVPNLLAIARREVYVRIRTRSFLIGTVLLVLGVVAIAMAPVLIRSLDRATDARIAVWSDVPDLSTDPVTTLSVLLNVRTGGAEVPVPGERFEVHPVADLAAGRRAVEEERETAVLAIQRGGSGELTFTLYTNESATGRTAQLIQQATAAVAISDRLSRLGVGSTDQAGIFQPPGFSVAWPDPERDGAPTTREQQGAGYLLGFGMTILIFMLIILYGQWVAMSVVDEKTSRVMEVILNAATPFQLMAGKVIGVGAVAVIQYLAILAAGLAALWLQGPLAAAVLGGSQESVSLPEGLTVGMLGLLCVYGVLGFLLYAVLYAAAGSLVSRQEDVNQAVTPMTLVAAAGYMVAVYSASGLLDIRSTWLAVLSQIPFFSPFLILSRSSAGETAPWEILLSIAILVVSIVAALWVAARIYAAGVLLYGQRPGLRALLRMMRTGI